MKAHIQVIQVSDTKILFFSCDLCRNKFTLDRFLKTHIESIQVSDTKILFFCDLCRNIFTLERFLNMHIQAIEASTMHRYHRIAGLREALADQKCSFF